jgi:hypothetical protein
VGAAALVSMGIVNGSGDDFLEIALPARRAGEGAQMNYANQELETFVEETGQKG